MSADQYRGRFRVAGQEKPASGMIVSDHQSGEIILEMDASLELPETPQLSEDQTAIHGSMFDGSDVSLLGCFPLDLAKVPGRAATAKMFSCRFLLKGREVDATETYARVQFSLTDLVPWLNWRAFTTHSSFESGGATYSLTTQPVHRAGAETNRGTLEFYSWPAFESSHHFAQVRTVAGIRVAPKVPATLSNILKLYCRPLQDLLTIAAGRAQEVTDLAVVSSRLVKSDQSPLDRHDWCEVQFPRWSDQRSVSGGAYPHEMLFVFPDIAASLAESLDSWFSLDEEVHEVRTLATGPTYRTGMFVDQRFLYAAHALEAYHRRRLGGTERTAAEHRQLIKDLVCAVPSEHRKWLKERLAFSNELSLLRRITELRQRACNATRNLLGMLNDWEKWVRDTRNYNTHFVKSSRKSRIARGTNLHALTESLQVLLDDVFMLELGLSELARSDRIQRTRRFARTQRWFAELEWTPS